MKLEEFRASFNIEDRRWPYKMDSMIGHPIIPTYFPDTPSHSPDALLYCVVFLVVLLRKVCKWPVTS